MSKRYAQLPITPELLHQLLDLPADVKIVGAKPSPSAAPWEPIQLWLEGDRFPEVEEGASVPEVVPIMTTYSQHVAKMHHDTLTVKEKT